MKAQRKVVALSSLLSLSAFAAGFEQLLTWSGRNVGRAGAVTSIIEGPDALYYNPAGLTDGSSNHIVFNASYMRSQFEAPVSTAHRSVESKIGNHISGSFFYSRALSEDLTLGIGVFPSAGLKVEYDPVTAPLGTIGTPMADFKVIEVSAGAAYKITSKLSVGLAYRISHTMAEFTAIKGPAVAEFKNMSGTDYFAFRAGAQYKEANWGLGVNVRTPVAVKIEGDLVVRSPMPTQSDSSSEISTTLPLAVAIAGHYYVIPELALLFEYDYLNYNATDDLAVKTSIAGVNNVDLKWRDAHIVRLGLDWSATPQWSLRTGYIVSTPIANEDTQLPTTEAPGFGQLYTVGTGFAFTENLRSDFSVFYGFAEKKTSPRSGADTLAGTYRSEGIGLHAGLGYKF